MKEFRIQTRFGYFVQPERICGVNFPMSMRGEAKSATIYYGKLSAQKTIKHYKIDGWVEEFNEEGTVVK